VPKLPRPSDPTRNGNKKFRQQHLGAVMNTEGVSLYRAGTYRPISGAPDHCSRPDSMIDCNRKGFDLILALRNTPYL